jgi:sugar phosphate isomerase/epimerase
MRAGVSSACLYPQLLELSVEDIAKVGIKATEIFINTDCELELNYVRELKRILDYYGTECVSVHPYTCPIEPMMFFTDYERRVQDVLEYYAKYFQAMNILGAEILVFHGNKAIVPVDENLYFDRFYRLSELGRKYGVTVAQENVARCQCNNVPFMVNMVKQLGDVAKFVIDLKQAIRSNVDIYDILESVGENIAHIHISDHTAQKDCLPIGKGILDVHKLINVLKSKGFDGAIMLELYRSNFSTLDELYQSYELLAKCISDAQ